MPCSRRWGLERRETCAFSGLEFELKLFGIESNVENPILDSTLKFDFPAHASRRDLPYSTDVLALTIQANAFAIQLGTYPALHAVRCIMLDRFP